MIKSGIQTLDALLNGGIKEGSKILIKNTPEIANQSFIQQVAYTILSQKKKVAYITNNKRIFFLKKKWKEEGYDIRFFEKRKKLILIDAYAHLLKKEKIEVII